VVTREGMPADHEAFDGNRVDVTTVEKTLGKTKGRCGKASLVWVMDRGTSSASNIHWQQRTDRRYLIGASKQELKKLERELVGTRDWITVRDVLETKILFWPFGPVWFVGAGLGSVALMRLFDCLPARS
jgi:transposase